MCFNKILFLGPDYRNHNGGIGAVLSVYARNISPFKFIATYKGGKGFFYNFFFFIYAAFSVFKKLLFDHNIDVVHIHGSSKGSFFRKFILFIFIKFLFRKKVVYHMHGAIFHEFYEDSVIIVKKLIVFMVNNVDMIVCLSNRWYEFFKSNFNPKLVFIVNNPIELLDDSSAKSKNALKKMMDKWPEVCADDFKMQLLFLGRIGPRKGIFDLLEVISRNRQTYEGKLELLIGGDGDVDQLREFITDNELQDIVRYVGWVSGHVKEELLKNVDVYVLPSYNEGLPVSLLEAMNYGLPIISTDVGGIPEIVFNGLNGFINRPGDLNALENSINHFFDSPKDLFLMGAASKNLVKNYDIQSVKLNLNLIYSNILN